jgi:hypothetical protein
MSTMCVLAHMITKYMCVCDIPCKAYLENTQSLASEVIQYVLLPVTAPLPHVTSIKILLVDSVVPSAACMIACIPFKRCTVAEDAYSTIKQNMRM